MTSYSQIEVARIFNLSRARLRYWERTALVQPSQDSEGRPAYGFRDLVCVKTVLVLLQRGVPLRRIRRSVEAIRERIPELDRPLGALRVSLEGSDHVVVRHEGVLYEPDGQLVLDFHLAPSTPDDVAPLSRPRGPETGGADPQTAIEWFERGCQLDSDPQTADGAVEAYGRALEADPGFADAHCNLGTVHYNRGRRDEARGCYERAVACEADHIEANFNLATLLEEEGRDEVALRHYKAALRADPLYPDIHLNLALLYERLTLRRKAREHWRRYLQLQPSGSWAEVARKHLEE